MTIADRKPIKCTDTTGGATHNLPPAGFWEEDRYSIAHRQLVSSVPTPGAALELEIRLRKLLWRGGRPDETRSPSGGISAYRVRVMLSDSQHCTPEAV